MEGDKLILTGNPVSPGIAMAKACLYYPSELVVEEGHFKAGAEQENMAAFCGALNKTKEKLVHLYEKLVIEDEEKAKIFLAHMAFLEDEEILDGIQRAIEDEHMNPDYAVNKVFDDFSSFLSKVADPLIAGRAVDVQDVKRRLIRIYQGKEEKNLSILSEDVIVIARDLLPSDIATLSRQRVKGIVAETGGSNSHAAILARSFQIPAVFGVIDAVKEIPDGALLSMDALSGILIVHPEKSEQIELEEKRDAFLKKRKVEQEYLDKPGKLKDGTSVEIGINVDSIDFDVPKNNYDFIGLVRTEFLYMENTHLPTEEEQFEAYKKVLQKAKGKPVTLRTLDIGGDKMLPYMEVLGEEQEKRGLQFCFSEPEIFITQLRAALRASAYGSLQIMFPMVETMEDIYKAKAYVKEAMKQLERDGDAFDKNVKLGIMIEVPSIILIADMVAQEVDFASIGTNDLVQHISGIDRNVSDAQRNSNDSLPEMIDFIERIAQVFKKQGKELSVCGEMAAAPETAAVLVGIGIRKFSMDVSNIAVVKKALAQISLKDAKARVELVYNSI